MPDDRDKWDGRACLAMFKAICKDSWDRYNKWFDENPHKEFCYWSKDEPIPPEGKHDKELLSKHPEIEDIDDHTIVERDGSMLVFTKFCPRMRDSISKMLGAEGRMDFSHCGMLVSVRRDSGNYKVTVREAI